MRLYFNFINIYQSEVLSRDCIYKILKSILPNLLRVGDRLYAACVTHQNDASYNSIIYSMEVNMNFDILLLNIRYMINAIK